MSATALMHFAVTNNIKRVVENANFPLEVTHFHGAFLKAFSLKTLE